MKTTLLTAAFALACAFSVNAQDRKGEMMKSPEMRAQRHAEMMAKHLNLTADQRAKIERIDLQTAKDMQPSMDAATRDRDKMRAMHQQREEQYKQVLNQQQYAEYQKMQEERKARHAHRMGEMQKGNRNMVRPNDAAPVQPAR